MSERAAIFVISGAKGGVGCTTFTVNLAASLARKGSVLIVDMDGECGGDAALAFGMVDSARSVADVVNKLNLTPRLIQGYLGVGVDNIGLLQVAGEESPVPAVIASPSDLYSYILIDAGSEVDGRAKSVFPLAHRLVVVSGSDRSSIIAAVKKLKGLRRLGVNNNLVDIVVNCWETKGGLTEAAIHEKLGEKAGCFLPSAGSDMGEAWVQGAPLGLTDSSHQFVAAVQKFSERLAEVNLNERLLLGTALAGPEEVDKPGSADDIKARVLNKLSSTKEIKKLIAEGEVRGKNRAFLEQKIKVAIHDILDGDPDCQVRDRNSFVKDVTNEAIGLGPLEKFMADPRVTEVMVNAADEIYVERGGKIEKVDAHFSSVGNVMAVIERIVAPLGRRIDESSPIVDARLPDGSRVHVVIPPLSLKGPTITIRKFARGVFSTDNLISYGSLDRAMSDFLKLCVEMKVNILVSGGTGSGKTTMLNVLSSFIPADERIVTIEDSAELKLAQPHVVRMEARPPNIEGRGEVSIRDLVKASLRMRPDRIIVGECRGAEALDMLQAMNTGHEGSLTTIHANSPRDSLARLETLVLFAGFDLPVKAIREQITSAIDLIIQIKRQKDGSRKVVDISEVTGLEGQVITMQELFSYKGGSFVSTGFRPKFLETIPSPL